MSTPCLGTIVFQEDGVTKSVGETELKIALTRGLKEAKSARLIIIGTKVSQLHCRVNFGGVIDVLLREYWSLILAFIVVQMIFISASMIRGKRPTRILWDVLDAIGTRFELTVKDNLNFITSFRFINSIIKSMGEKCGNGRDYFSM